jgi:ADP-ribosyl-[dinitrogen reductase] hydrolase
MRLAPVVLFFHKDPEKAIHYAGESSRTTHAAPQALACCRQWARLILMALDGRSKDEIVAAPCPEADPVVRAAATGCQAKPRLAIEGAGYVVKSLEAALWCFAQTASFDEGCLTAANLGDDADTVAAIYGQLAGAYYGEPGIPDSWLRVLAWSDRIRAMAEDLLRQGSEGR